MNPYISPMVWSREVEAAEDRISYIERTTPLLLGKWWREYMRTGQVAFLNWETEDFEAAAFEMGVSDFKEILRRKCISVIEEAIDANQAEPWHDEILNVYEWD